MIQKELGFNNKGLFFELVNPSVSMFIFQGNKFDVKDSPNEEDRKFIKCRGKSRLF